MAPGSLSDELTSLRRALETSTRELERVSGRLRDLSPEECGPHEVVVAVSEVVTRLERRLDTLAAISRDAAVVARRHGGTDDGAVP